MAVHLAEDGHRGWSTKVESTISVNRPRNRKWPKRVGENRREDQEREERIRETKEREREREKLHLTIPLNINCRSAVFPYKFGLTLIAVNGP